MSRNAKNVTRLPVKTNSAEAMRMWIEAARAARQRRERGDRG